MIKHTLYGCAITPQLPVLCTCTCIGMQYSNILNYTPQDCYTVGHGIFSFILLTMLLVFNSSKVITAVHANSYQLPQEYLYATLFTHTSLSIFFFLSDFTGIGILSQLQKLQRLKVNSGLFPVFISSLPVFNLGNVL